ncbi:MAG: endonuclease/exonuclease/phosphatase family protein, partial [Promethearchaeota archaeon]
PTSRPVIIEHPPHWYSYISLIGMIILTPILFIDFTFTSRILLKQKPSLSKLSKGFTLGGILFILLSFSLIFTNTWGYIEPVSPYFRNLFWLPFVLAGLFFTLPFLTLKNKMIDAIKRFKSLNQKPLISAVLIILILFTALGVFLTNPIPKSTKGDKVVSLRILTYNIQQGVNNTGDKNYDKQLELIKQVNPDIIGLQESDPARISGGNSDVVRYFANRLTGLNYYSFYGPKTVTGTYGAAVLSKYPIISAKTIFTYSDVDEVGITYVQILIGNEIFNVFVNHPAGSKEAKLAHVEVLLGQIDGKEDVISMGDFNSREGSIYYEMQAAVLKDVWRARWPSGIDDNGLDMRRRIDHIFVSKEFTVIEARFIIDPQSDHPALWTEIKI